MPSITGTKSFYLRMAYAGLCTLFFDLSQCIYNFDVHDAKETIDSVAWPDIFYHHLVGWA